MAADALILDGWDEIVTHVEVVTGMTRSERTVRRWAEFVDDPLPTFRAPGGRSVLAEAGAIEAWWSRTVSRRRTLPIDQ